MIRGTEQVKKRRAQGDTKISTKTAVVVSALVSVILLKRHKHMKKNEKA